MHAPFLLAPPISSPEDHPSFLKLLSILYINSCTTHLAADQIVAYLECFSSHFGVSFCHSIGDTQFFSGQFNKSRRYFNRVLKQATVDNLPVGVRWISGLIWSALFQVEKLNILSKSRYNVDLILVVYTTKIKSTLKDLVSTELRSRQWYALPSFNFDYNGLLTLRKSSLVKFFFTLGHCVSSAWRGEWSGIILDFCHFHSLSRNGRFPWLRDKTRKACGSPDMEGNIITLALGSSHLLKDGAYYCYCAYVLRISRYSDFLSPMLTNTGIFFRGLKISGESRS